MSTTPVLGLYLPPAGETGWTDQINGDFTLIDTAVGALRTAVAAGVVFVWKGPYSASTAYVAGNAVSYNGSSYIAIAASTGATPSSSPSDWQLFAQAGSGGIVWAGSWSGSTAYAIGNAVSYNGSSYIAIAASTGSEPDTNPSIWSPLALGGTGPAGPAGATGAPGAPGPGVGAGAVNQFAIYTGTNAIAGDANLTETPGPGGALSVLSYAGVLEVSEGIVAGGVQVAQFAVYQSLEIIGIYDPGEFDDTSNGLIFATQNDGSTGDAGLGYFINAPGPGGAPGGFEWWVTDAAGSLPSTAAMGLDASGDLLVLGALVLGGAPLTVGAGKLSIGATTATTATAGAATLPAKPVGFFEWNLGGVAIKIPYYAP